MGHELIDEFLTGDSEEVRDLANNEAALVGFLTLIKGVDDLPDMNARFYEQPRSLYQVTSTGHAIDELMAILSEFFGPPVKSPDENLPVSLRFDPTVKFLGGIRKDQAFFLKKLKTGSFYGALWPWQRNKEKIEVLLGYYASGMDDEDYSQMESLVQRFLSQKKMESVPEVGGQIHGISLPSFLQMSEMEGATYTLRVTSGGRTGYLHLDGGGLIAASYGDWAGNEAAYRIISWDKAAIQIEAADPECVREIHEPLMHVMMESLKIKDEQGAQSEAPSPKPSQPEPQPEPVPEPEPEPEPEHEAEAEPELVLEMERKPPAQQEAAEASSEPVEDHPEPTTPPIPTRGSESFVKPEDRSIGKQDQMSRQTKLLIVLGVVIVFALGVTFGGKLLKKRSIDRRYDRLNSELAATKELDAQVVMLLQYIKANPNDAHIGELEARLKNTNAEIEKREYEKTLADVRKLPIDENYQKKALSLYTAYLAQYPQSDYAEKINASIGNINRVLAAAAFEDLKTITTDDFLERYAAYNGYLEKFPQSTKRAEVARMIESLALAFYRAIEKQRVICDEQKVWDECISECDRFLTALGGTPAAENVKALRKDLLDKSALAKLTAKVALVGDNYAEAKKMYVAFLNKNPNTSQKPVIRSRIDALDADLARQAAWKETAAFAVDSGNDILIRIQRLDAYVDAHGKDPYVAEARKLREQLEPQLKSALRMQRTEAAQRKALASKQAEAARRAEDAERIQRLQSQVARQLAPVAGRYVDNRNGTVTDRVTGLTWCLLDSQLVLGRCFSYNAAKSYVARLDTGGYTDWRLPTAGELAALYKNSPYFPDTGASWYWTSETFARGFHRVVDVVTPVPESVFKRMSKNEDSCGAVRAVRR